MMNTYPIELIVRTSLESLPTRDSRIAGRLTAHARTDEGSNLPLHELKRRMLVDALEQTPDTGLFKRLCGAANQAADLAWETAAPALTFPTFFEDLVRSIRERRA